MAILGLSSTAVSGFQEFLRDERGLTESTIHGYRHHLHDFEEYLRKARITSFGELSPALVSFCVDAVYTAVDCCHRGLDPEAGIFKRRELKNWR
jgi:site-specific recombinase XerD